MIHPRTAAVLFASAALMAAGCGTNSRQQDARSMEDVASRLQTAQPIPAVDWSQFRQTIIDAETAQAKGTQTTTFWFSRGAGGNGNPIGSCPSLGFPVPASAQLSNPMRDVGTGGPIGQMEPNGVYSGPTDGTYVVCAGTGGKPYLVYTEADVTTVGGAAEWKDGQAVLIGDPTIKPGVKK